MYKVKTVDEYILNNEKWQQLLLVLREIMLSTNLEETIKWGMPVYTLKNKNIAGLGAFKHHVAIWFYQGALLTDKTGILYNAQDSDENAVRQLRYESLDDIDAEVIVQFLDESIKNHKAGKKVEFKTKPLVLPTELKEAFGKNKNIEISFKQFTPSKQKEFARYIDSAKRLPTRQKRLEKSIDYILSNRSLMDDYR